MLALYQTSSPHYEMSFALLSISLAFTCTRVKTSTGKRVLQTCWCRSKAPRKHISIWKENGSTGADGLESSSR